MAKKKESKKALLSETGIGEGFHYGGGMISPVHVTENGMFAYYIDLNSGRRTLEFYTNDQIKERDS